mgnify:CR=1 FL=1
MKTEIFTSRTIEEFLRREKIATMEQLKKALGTAVAVTVFRKLQELSHMTSYSHRGKYYALKASGRFDNHGLWSHRSVWFSQYGNLLKTIVELVNQSPHGYTANELEEFLHVIINKPLLTLIEREQLIRDKIEGVYVYFSADKHPRFQQMKIRKTLQPIGLVVPSSQIISADLKAAIILFFCVLDEQQRRLYAGVESLKLGHGGDRFIAELLGISEHTVARGRNELMSNDIDRDRIRAPGGGRPRVEKKHQN